MNPQEGSGRGRFGTAAALVVAAMLFPVLRWPLLCVAALGGLLLLLPPRRPGAMAAGVAAVALAAMGLLEPGIVGAATFAWTAMVAGSFVLASLARPEWPFLSRALAAVAAGFGMVGAWLAGTGRWGALDGTVHRSFRTLTETWLAQLSAQGEGREPLVEALAKAAELAAEAQWTVFPALAALQTLATLALAWWLFARFAPHGGLWAQLRPLRELRFNDHLVWVAIGGLLLVALPPGGAVARVGVNVLAFMGGLYALRGVAVLLGTTKLSPAILALVLFLFAISPLGQFVLVAALLVGIGDTWLDLRARAAQPSRA